jgi:GAF domain-containing protein
MRPRSKFSVNETQRYAAAGILFGLLFPIVATVIRIANLGLPLNISSVVFVHTTDSLLWIIDTAPLFLGLFASLAGRRQDKLQTLNTELTATATELKGIQSTLEQRVEQRTLELSAANQKAEKRAAQLQTIAEIARAVVTAENIEGLLKMLTQVISQRFGFYHVGIFLLDEFRQYAVLRAANSEGGGRMIQRGHKLRVGEQGVVGFAAQSGSARIALDVGADPAFLHNPDLPETRSEMALPLKYGGQTIGVMDIQSTEERAFTEDDVATLSILADQVAIAIRNTLLYEQSQRALREVEAASARISGQEWKRFVKTVQTRGYRFDGVRSESLKEASESGQENGALFVPVQLRGQVIGRLKLKASDGSREWTEDELAIAQATAERVALALEGARLLEDAQKRAARETFLSDIAAKLGSSFQLDAILRDTVEELGGALKDSTISFQLVNPSSPRGFESE